MGFFLFLNYKSLLLTTAISLFFSSHRIIEWMLTINGYHDKRESTAGLSLKLFAMKGKVVENNVMTNNFLVIRGGLHYLLDVICHYTDD